MRPVIISKIRGVMTQHSVYRTAHLSHSDICSLGKWRVAPSRNKAPYGYAQTTVGHVLVHGRKVEPSEPPKGHAHITNWPMTTEERLSVAQQIAEGANLQLL